MKKRPHSGFPTHFPCSCSDDESTKISFDVAVGQSCDTKSLNGSWLLLIQPATPIGGVPTQRLRGPLRIEVGTDRIRVSGDIYAQRLTPGQPSPSLLEPSCLVIEQNWYPSYPQKEYRWYFRSRGVTYKTAAGSGRLNVKLTRHIWVTATQEFGTTDDGSLELDCVETPITLPDLPQPTIQMKGKLNLGEETFEVVAIKTSPFFRGCAIEVDAMVNRTFPSSAKSCPGTQTFTFTGIYRTHGLDFLASVDESNIPHDAQLTTAELHNLLANHRQTSGMTDMWRLWILVGSRESGGSFGVMFDDQAPHREGVVGFFDELLGNESYIQASARGQKIGSVPLAFLRTLVHEAGHAFNLFHPKHDIHTVPVGTTLMNQTGDIMGFSNAANPFPCSATMSFDQHQHVSLVHSPDPQVKPGWKQFGWGHGNTSSGLSEPTDVAGLEEFDEAAGLRLDVQLPTEVHLGEFVIAQLTLTNVGDSPKTVPANLNLAEGNLWAIVSDPTGQLDDDVRDIVYACGNTPKVQIQPGESITSAVQLYYTNRGLLFRRTGTYRISFELDLANNEDEIVRSQNFRLHVRAPETGAEQELADLLMHRGVGTSLALGDIVPGSEAEKRVDECAEKYSSTLSGLACKLLQANSSARVFHDLQTGKVVRKADTSKARRVITQTLKTHKPVEVASAAAAVVSPIEAQPPVIAYLNEAFDKPTSKLKLNSDSRNIIAQLLSSTKHIDTQK
jgi:hypothetical protein